MDNLEKLHIPQNFDDKTFAERLKNSYAALSSEEADKVLVASYEELINETKAITAFPDKNTYIWLDSRLRDYISPYVNSENLIMLYNANKGYISRVCCYLDKEIVFQACRESFSDERNKKDFLKNCRVSDGKLVSDCDIGNHVFVFERYEYESITERDDTADLTIKYKLYRCKACGSFQRERDMAVNNIISIDN